MADETSETGGTGGPTVVHVPELHRWEIRDGDALAGFVEYVREDGDRFVLTHTEIDPAFEGRGMGGALARGALDDLRSAGASLVPMCPFIAGWVEKHPDYEPLVDRARYEELKARR